MQRCSWALVLCLGVAACGGDDMPTYGTRGDCAEGGAINECDDPELTPEAACDKLVACGVIARDSNDNGNDYAQCVDEIYSRGNDGTAAFITACIAATGCDELAAGFCFAFGDN